MEQERAKVSMAKGRKAKTQPTMERKTKEQKAMEQHIRERDALKQTALILEDSEPWARYYMSLPAPRRLVDVDRMAASILDALIVVRGVIDPTR